MAHVISCDRCAARHAVPDDIEASICHACFMVVTKESKRQEFNARIREEERKGREDARRIFYGEMAKKAMARGPRRPKVTAW